MSAASGRAGIGHPAQLGLVLEVRSGHFQTPSPVSFRPVTRARNLERAHGVKPLVHREDAVRVVEHLLYAVMTLEGRSA